MGICCAKHGDPASHSVHYSAMFSHPFCLLVCGYALSTDCVAATLYWDETVSLRTRFMEWVTADPFKRRPEFWILTIPRKDICRLHLQGRCRFGADCHRLHICREHLQFQTTAKGGRFSKLSVLKEPVDTEGLAGSRLLKYIADQFENGMDDDVASACSDSALD